MVDVEPIRTMVNNIEYKPQNRLAIDKINSGLKPLTEHEIMEIVEKWAGYKKKEGWRFTGSKGGKLQYEYEEDGSSQIIRLNTKHTSTDLKYYPIIISVLPHEIRLSTDNGASVQLDVSLTTLYVKKKIEKNEEFRISLFFHLISKTNSSYNYFVERYGDPDKEELKNRVSMVKHNLEKHNIGYDGDWEELVLKGSSAIDLEHIVIDDGSASEIE